jgi:hypothetical protein
MKTERFSDAYWTVRFAPYALAIALGVLVVSMFWALPPLAYLLPGIAAGGLVFVFHALRWRTGQEVFQLAAMVTSFVPLFYLMFRLRGKITIQEFQYLAIFIVSYTAAVVIFRRRVLKGSEQ